MKTLCQILAIARTEFRFGVRRGAPVVVTAVIGLLLGAGLLMNAGNNLQMADPHMDQYTPEQVQKLARIGITADDYRVLARDEFADFFALDATQSWFFLYLALLFLPVATAGALPAERKFGAMELMRSLPMDGSSYLAGKALGTFALVVFIACFPFLLFLVILEGITIKNFGAGVPWGLVAFYAKLSLLDGLPVLAFATLIGILAGAASRSRRAALLPGFAAGAVSIFFWLWAFRAPDASGNTYDLLAYRLFQGYPSLWQADFTRLVDPTLELPSPGMAGVGTTSVGAGQIAGMVFATLLAIAGAALLARLWLQWKENF